MDILSSQDNLAGYKAAIEAVNMLNRAVPMMTTAAGSVMPAKILVVGIGVAGLQAIATAKGWAPSSLPTTSGRKPANRRNPRRPLCRTGTLERNDCRSGRRHYRRRIAAPGTDIVQTKEIGLLKAGSVLIDVSGNVEGPGSPETFTTENGAVVTVDRQMASLLPDTASRLFANNLCNFFRLLGSGPAAGQTPILPTTSSTAPAFAGREKKGVSHE